MSSINVYCHKCILPIDAGHEFRFRSKVNHMMFPSLIWNSGLSLGAMLIPLGGEGMGYKMSCRHRCEVIFKFNYVPEIFIAAAYQAVVSTTQKLKVYLGEYLSPHKGLFTFFPSYIFDTISCQDVHYHGAKWTRLPWNLGNALHFFIMSPEITWIWWSDVTSGLIPW